MSRLKHQAPWLIVFIICSVFLGYSLAGPTRLNVYFSAKPGPDLVIDALLILAASIVAFKWLNNRNPWLVILIPFLALSWMKVDFILYSMSEWFSVISYAYIALWGICLAAFWKYFGQRKSLGFRLFLGLMGGLAGFYWGYGDQTYWYALGLATIMMPALPFTESGFVKTSRGIISEKISWLLYAAPWLVPMSLPDAQFFESQSKFEDKVIFSQQTRFQRIDVTEWEGNYWFYQDGINQFSSIDSWLYFEPFVHPVMQLVQANAKILVIGGENGMLLRELEKYPEAEVVLMPVDEEFLKIAQRYTVFNQQHGDVFQSGKAEVSADEIFRSLDINRGQYDVIFVDVPDPIDIELNQYFTKEFYQLCNGALTENGYLVSQSGSPYFATAAFNSIQMTMTAAGFEVGSYHNQVLTLGEWAWTIGAKQETELDSVLWNLSFNNIETAWLNQEAMQMMLSFGKPYVTSGKVEVNTIKNPVIYQYYTQGNYQLN